MEKHRKIASEGVCDSKFSARSVKPTHSLMKWTAPFEITAYFQKCPIAALTKLFLESLD
jgi:hypothetical protein